MGIINDCTVIASHKGYVVGGDGSVISPYGRTLKLNYNKKTKYPYYSFSIIDNEGRRRTVPVHKLVAYQKFGREAFQKGVHIRHLNSNSMDNSEGNIELGSASDNMLDIPKEKRVYNAIRASTCVRKFSDKVVLEIKAKRDSGVTYSTLMKEYNITSKGTLSYLINNKYKTKVI